MFSFTQLEGKRVRLIPLAEEHVYPLFESASSPEIWTNYPLRISTVEDMQRFIVKAIEARERKEQFPFAVYDKACGQLVGSTRYLRISEEHNILNIGSTWYSPAVWRTRVNTETKYLLLSYAFESLRVNRVEIITTTDNIRSQRAIERIGAVREGVLRKKYYNMDYVIYSVIDSEWNAVKGKLEALLDDTMYVN